MCQHMVQPAGKTETHAHTEIKYKKKITSYKPIQQRKPNKDKTIRFAVYVNSTKWNSCMLLLLFRFLYWCAPIVDGGFWLESCNRTSVLLWTVTSLNRCKQRRLFCSASPLYNFILFVYFPFHFDFNIERIFD